MKKLLFIAPILLTGCNQTSCLELQRSEEALTLEHQISNYDEAEAERTRHRLIVVRDRFEQQCPNEYWSMRVKRSAEVRKESRRELNRILGR